MAVIELNSQNFEKEVLESNVPVVIDFWAAWCGPCKMMAPVVEELAQEFSSSVKVCKVNIDENQELAEKYNVMSIPTFIAIKNKNVTGMAVGVQSKEKLIKALEL